MSLSRFGAQLREHNWTAAAIELVIVVVGVLIALQVSNWNQDRLDRARADSYYRRLHASLNADPRIIDDTVSFWHQVEGYARDAMAYSEIGQRVDDSNWKTLLAYYQASQLMPLELKDTSFLEMRSRGDLGLIEDENLRERISDYYQITTGNTTRATIHRHDPEYRRQVRGLTPWDVQQYIWSRCFVLEDGTHQRLIDCPAPISEEAAGSILAGYRQADTLLPNLRFWMSSLRISEIALEDTRRSAVDLAREVEAARRR